MSAENLEQRQAPDFGADELGRVKFVPCKGSISGLCLTRCIDESFLIGYYQSGNFIQFQLLFWNNTPKEEGVTIATSVFRDKFQLQSQQHTFKIGKAYQLENTDIRLVPHKYSLEHGPVEINFVIDAPRNIPILRTELINKPK